MARRANDLLDVFRLGSAEGRTTGRGASKGRGGSKGGGGKGRSGRASQPDGVVLTSRQVVLGSSVLVLLLVLAFMAGLGFGKGRGEALRHDTPKPEGALYIRGTMPDISRTTGRPPDLEKIVEDLGAMGLEPQYVHIDEAANRLIPIHIGPFTSADSANQWLAELRKARLASEWPFRFGEPVFLER